MAHFYQSSTDDVLNTLQTSEQGPHRTRGPQTSRTIRIKCFNRRKGSFCF